MIDGLQRRIILCTILDILARKNNEPKIRLNGTDIMLRLSQVISGYQRVWSCRGSLFLGLPRSDTCFTTWDVFQWPPTEGPFPPKIRQNGTDIKVRLPQVVKKYDSGENHCWLLMKSVVLKKIFIYIYFIIISYVQSKGRFSYVCCLMSYWSGTCFATWVACQWPPTHNEGKAISPIITKKNKQRNKQNPPSQK